MELMQWFFMGVLFTLSVFALAYLSMRVKIQWYAWAGLITGVIMVLFGIGWGLVGLCPGPALVNLAGLGLPVIVFVAAMAAGMIGQDMWSKQKAAKPGLSETAIATSTDG